MPRPTCKRPSQAPSTSRRGRPRAFPAGSVALRGYFTAEEAAAIERAAEAHGKSVAYLVSESTRAGYRAVVQRLAGIPQMEEA